MENTGVTQEMPRYKCHKEVWAFKIKELEQSKVDLNHFILTPEEKGFLPINITKEYVEKHKPEVGGYYVVYKDGYKSYSPAIAFEEGYLKVN